MLKYSSLLRTSVPLISCQTHARDVQIIVHVRAQAHSMLLSHAHGKDAKVPRKKVISMTCVYSKKMTGYVRCGHCDKSLSEKTYKEHKRMFYVNSEWTTPTLGYTVTDSRSSPMDLSEPESEDLYQSRGSQYEAVSIMPSDKRYS